MRDSLLRWFRSVRLVQEVSSSSSPSPSVSHRSSRHKRPPNDHAIPNETMQLLTSMTKAKVTHDREASHHATPSSPVRTGSTYWPTHSVQPIPFSFNNYAPTTPNLAQWTSWSDCPKQAREIRNWLLGSASHTTQHVPNHATSPAKTAAQNQRTTRISTRTHRSRRASLSKPPLQVITSHRTNIPYPTSPRTAEAGIRVAAPHQITGKAKPKSQKRLCLWPLPVITHHVILLAIIVSTFNLFNILHVSCSSPSFVIHRLEVVNLFLSPFLFDWSLCGVLLFVWNMLILGLLEESLTHMLGGTRRFVHVLVGVILSVCTIRQGLGYLFSKSTGWAIPSLFFSDSAHECNQGFAPFLFALLTIQSLSIDDKYMMIFGDGDSSKITVRKVTLQLAMCLLNYTVKNILWWSLTGVLTGYLVTIIIQACLVHEKRSSDAWDESDMPTTPVKDGHRVAPLWRVLATAVKKGAIVTVVTLSVLLICSCYYYHRRSGPVDPDMLNQLTDDRYFFTFVMMTAPRRGDPPLLSQTLDSYLANWPVDPEPGSLYSRIQLLVYTHFTTHVQFDQARENFSNGVGGQRYIKWVREEGDQMNQRLHVSKALDMAVESFQSSYIALLEDDFPVCGKRAWQEIQNVVYEANQHNPNHCGIFVGTGGSGLFMKPKIAKLVSRLLLEYSDTPPDIVIQQCLRGDISECSQCHQSLTTSKTLLMYHIGYNTSTSVNRVYKKGEFQCGWRHPFNGDPRVITL